MIDKSSTIQELIDEGLLTVRAINALKGMCEWGNIDIATFKIANLETYENKIRKTPHCGKVTVDELGKVLIAVGVDIRERRVTFNISLSEEREIHKFIKQRRNEN